MKKSCVTKFVFVCNIAWINPFRDVIDRQLLNHDDECHDYCDRHHLYIEI